MRIYNIEPGFATNHSNPISVNYHVLIKGSLTRTYGGVSDEGTEDCDTCNNREECTPPSGGMGKAEIGCVHLRKGNTSHCELCWNRDDCELQEYSDDCGFRVVCTDCDEYYNCIDRKISANAKDKWRTGEYTIVSIQSGMDTFECNCRGTMEYIAELELKELFIKYRSVEIIRGYSECDGSEWDESGPDIPKWRKGRILVHYYVLIENPINTNDLHFPMGNFSKDCTIISGVVLGQNPFVRDKLNKEEVAKLDEGTYLLLDVCGHSFSKSGSRIGRAKKYADSALEKLKKGNSILKIVGSRVEEASRCWELSEEELPSL